MSTWIIIALVWFVVGLICWAVILRFFPPTPKIDPRQRGSVADEPKGRSFSIRDVAGMALAAVPIAALAPPLLIIMLCHRMRRQKSP